MNNYQFLTLPFEPLHGYSILKAHVCDSQSKVSFSQTQNPHHGDVIDSFSIASPLTDGSPYSAITAINGRVRIDAFGPSCESASD
jgi:hypothetical protein